MAAETMKITFTEDYEVKDDKRGTPEATRYRRGQKVSLSPASAFHFIGRGVAELTAGSGGSGA